MNLIGWRRIAQHVTFEVFDGDDLIPIQPAEDYNIRVISYTAELPTPRTYRVKIEGRNGELDMSEWAGQIFYGDRQLTVWLRDRWDQAEAFVQRILGKRCRIVFDMDDPEWCYIGRCDSITPQTNRQRVTDLELKFTCHPFRYPAIGEADDYAPGSGGQAYSGRREFTLTAASGETDTAERTLHQAEVSPMTVVISGLAEGVTGCKLTVNGVDYAITGNGTMEDQPPMRPGSNTVVLTNTANGQSLTAAVTFEDRVI